MTAPVRITIDVWSDVMCPWCIIGYLQLQKGLDLLSGEVTAELRWHAFELNPDMPPEGEDQAGHVQRKYGRTAAQAAAGREQMRSIAASAGYSFAYTGPDPEPAAMMWNTFLAHKLLAWTLDNCGADAQTRLKLALFDAHFQQRRNVSDPAVLLAIAADLELAPTGARDALYDPVFDQRVHAEEAAAWDMNVSGVPAMVINGKFLIPGAQEPQTYADAIRRVVARGLTAA